MANFTSERLTAALYTNVTVTHRKNAAFSPAALAIALGTLYSTGRGATAAELSKILGFDSRTGAYFEELREKWEDRRATFGLTLLNFLCIDRTFNLTTDAASNLEKQFGAEIELADFERMAEDSRNSLNAKLAAKSFDVVRELLPAGSIDSHTCLVLANALHFRGLFHMRFELADTYDGDFRTPTGVIKAPMMHGKFKALHVATASFVAVELPYEGGDLGLTIVLPTQKDDMAAIDTAISSGALKQALPKMAKKEVTMTLPRFRINCRTEMTSLLQAAGLKNIFSDDADLSGLTPEMVHVNGVFHQVYVEVEEKGSEAAPASAVVVRRRSSLMKVEEPVKFVVDQPFAFLVRDLRQDVVVLIGRLIDPTLP
eukprot:TRINITY_DN2304_c0_g1_i1.p2 TRINITY_DN2304_c0_g1~~TRINITY_DN2304_c0_g1_i1.p2  ORF type:complete len:371 (-),score=64.12 TRINITY_DN2304_c0_g1_i1:1209-2321(-)